MGLILLVLGIIAFAVYLTAWALCKAAATYAEPVQTTGRQLQEEKPAPQYGIRLVHR